MELMLGQLLESAGMREYWVMMDYRTTSLQAKQHNHQAKMEWDPREK